MIKKFYFVLGLGAMVALSACDSKSTSSADNAEETTEQTEEVASTEAATPAIEQNEEQVISELMDMYSNTMEMQESYMTSDLLSYVGSAEMTAFKMGDEMGWIDYSMWTFSQDPDDSAKEVKNVKLNPDGTATADVYGGGFGPKGYVTVTVQLVDGHYRIDDIVNPADGTSIKAEAKKYLGRD